MPQCSPQNAAAGRKEGTQSIARALDILTLLAMGSSPRQGLRLGEIATYLDISRPTAHRILVALLERGFARKLEKSSRYIIGDEVPLLALAREGRLPLLQIVEPALQEMSRIVKDTVFFSIWSGRDVLTVARVVGEFPIQVLSIDVGDRRPLGAITSGVAMLAMLDDEASTRLVREDEARLGAFGLRARDVVDFIRDTRSRGFAYRQRAVIPGTKAVAVPVGRPGDPVVGAITVSGMAKRMTDARVQDIVADIRHHSEDLLQRFQQKHASGRL